MGSPQAPAHLTELKERKERKEIRPAKWRSFMRSTNISRDCSTSSPVRDGLRNIASQMELERDPYLNSVNTVNDVRNRQSQVALTERHRLDLRGRILDHNAQKAIVAT